MHRDPARRVAAHDDVPDAEHRARDVGHDGVDRVRVGHGGEAVGLVGAGALQHVLRQHVALHGAAAIVRVQVVERGGRLIEDRDLVALPGQPVRQLGSESAGADDDDAHQVLPSASPPTPADLVGHARDHDARTEEQRHAQEHRRLRVQQVVPGAVRHELRHHDRQDLVALALRRDLLDVVEQRLEQQAVRRIEHDQAHAVAPALPLLSDVGRAFRVVRDVDRGHVVRERARVAQGGQRAAVHAAHRDQDPVAVDPRRRPVVVERQARAQVAVVPVDREEPQHEQRDQQHDDPGTARELGHGEHHDDDGGTRRSDAVEQHLVHPAALVLQARRALDDRLTRRQVSDLPPAAGHAGLRQRERQEYADAYSGIRAVTLAWNATMSADAVTASTTMPRE